MNYYLVKCKFGHVGRNKYLPLIVPIVAESAKQASNIAKNIGGVKKDHKDWCLDGPHEVNFDQYLKAKEVFANDVYFEKRSRSRLHLFEGRLVDEPNYTRKNGIKTNTKIFIKPNNKERIEYRRKKEKELIKSLDRYQQREKDRYKGCLKLV